MTDTAEDLSLPDTLRDNLEAFKRHAPHLYGRLVTVSVPNSRLVAEGDKIDIEFRGQKFYGGDAVASTAIVRTSVSPLTTSFPAPASTCKAVTPSTSVSKSRVSV